MAKPNASPAVDGMQAATLNLATMAPREPADDEVLLQCWARHVLGESGSHLQDLHDRTVPDGDMANSRGSRTLTNSKRQALEAELRRVKEWCVTALPGLPIASAEYKAASALLDGAHAAEEQLGLREPHVGSLRSSNS